MRRVEICLWKIRSLRYRLTQNWVFLHTLFLENKAQIDRNNYGTMLFMSKQVSLPKISSILQKWKLAKIRYTPFLHEALQLLLNLVTILLCVQSLTWAKLVIQCNYILLAIQYNTMQLQNDATYNTTTCTGFSLRARHRRTDWNPVKKILPAWFNNLGNVFLIKRFSLKRLYLPVKTS